MDIEKIYLILRESLLKYKIPLAEQINVKTKEPFFVLIATILSSRTKDETTAKACDKLFKEVSSFKDIEKIDLKKLESILYPVGFYKTKARNLKKLSIIIKKQNYKIPKTLEELILLPGVGRKTANLVLSVAFKKDAICVDTHVHRIMNRIGYIKTNNALETEMVLRKKLPLKLWKETNYLFVILGQNICYPKKPNCSKCPINKYCEKNGVKL